MTTQMAKLLPKEKTIWMYWDSGAHTMPYFIQCCVQAWRHWHPAWDVVVVGSDSISSYLGVEELPAAFNVQRASLKSDFFRLAVLAKYGGVYVDISCLPFSAAADVAFSEALSGHCFVGYKCEEFASPYINCWFIAAQANEPIIAEWSTCLNALFDNRTSDKDVHKDPFFDGIETNDYVKGPLEVDDWRDYLVINLVLKTILDRDPTKAEKFFSNAVLNYGNSYGRNGKGPYGWMSQLMPPTTWDYESVSKHFLAQLRADVTHPNSSLVSVARQTPFMKLTNAKELYVAVRGPDDLLTSCSYIARLTRLALGLSESPPGFVGAQLGSNNADDLGLHVSYMSGGKEDSELAHSLDLVDAEIQRRPFFS
jgi:hypothetical protein